MQELKPGQNFSHFFPPVHTRSHRFTTVHTCSHLFPPVHTSLTIYTLRAMAASRWIFSLRKLLFFDLTRYFLKLHIFAHLIKSYPTVHGLSSCVEKKISIPLVAHTTVTMYARRTVIFSTFECSYSSVLRRILLKLHILTRLIESFPTLYSLWSCIEVKLSIPPGAHA